MDHTNRTEQLVMLARLKDHRELHAYMTFREFTCQSLADAVVDAQRGKPRRDRFTCSRSLISLLANGHRRGTQPYRARAIEKALDVRPGELFSYSLANHSRDGR